MSKQICPDFKPVTGGGAAPRCKAQHVCENFCYVVKCDATGAVLPGLHEYDIDENCVKTNETWKDVDGVDIDLTAIVQVECVAAAPVPPEEPVVPITIDGIDCEGDTVSVTGNPGELVSVVQAPGTVFLAKLCTNPKDLEKVVLCDKNTGHKVAVISDLTNPASPIVTTWDLNEGAAYTGSLDDLEACPDTDLESDPVEMCDGTANFLRWIVKSNGEPTGAKFDTDLTGAPYTVSSEAAVKVGKCEIVELESDAVDVCYDGNPLTMWVVKANSIPTGDAYYTDATGTDVTATVTDNTKLSLGACPCEPATAIGVQATW